MAREDTGSARQIIVDKAEFADLQAQLREAQAKLEEAVEDLLALPPRPGRWRLQKIIHILKEDKNEHAT